MRGAGSAPLRQDDLVVGFDGGTTSVDALALALPLARLWNVGVQVLSIHTPVVLGGRRAEAARERAARRRAEAGAARLDGGVRAGGSALRAGGVTAGLHAGAVGCAALVVGRAHPRPWRPRTGRSVLEDAPGPVAVARRDLRIQPRLRHVILALPTEQPREGAWHGGAFEALLTFAGRCLHRADLRVTLAALSTDADGVGDWLAAAAFQLSGVLERGVPTSVVAPHEAQWTWVDDELLVGLGRPAGHGHLRPDHTERTLLAGDGPSLLVLPPPVTDTRDHHGRMSETP